MPIANPYAGLMGPTPEQQSFLNALRERQAQAREAFFAKLPPAIAERLRNASQHIGPQGQYTGPPLNLMEILDSRFPEGMARARAQGGASPLANQAAAWNYAMLQHKSNPAKYPHPGPHPIDPSLSQLPPAPTPTPTPGAGQPGVGGGGVPGSFPNQLPPGIPPGGNLPGAEIVDPRFGGPVSQNPTSIGGVRVQPIGGTNVPANAPPIPQSGLAGRTYLDDLLEPQQKRGGRLVL